MRESGSHTTAVVGSPDRSSMTPTTVAGEPFTKIDRPTTARAVDQRQGDRRGAHPLVSRCETAAKHGPVAGDRERVARHVESFHALGGSAVSAQDHRRLRERHDS